MASDGIRNMARLSSMAGSMTANEFNEAMKKFPRLSEKARAVARAVLVDGATFEEVIGIYNTSRQLAHVWTSKVYQVFAPEGWESQIIVLPPDKMAIVRAMETEAREQWAMDSLKPVRVNRRQVVQS